jgi:hypothetical protein
VLSAWINEIERGAITSLLALKDGKVVGCGTVVRDPHSWSPHVGEIRMVVSTDVRGQGVGRTLSQETFALALGAGLEKFSAQMTVDQQAAVALFESLGIDARAAAGKIISVGGQTSNRPRTRQPTPGEVWPAPTRPIDPVAHPAGGQLRSRRRPSGWSLDSACDGFDGVLCLLELGCTVRAFAIASHL